MAWPKKFIRVGATVHVVDFQGGTTTPARVVHVRTDRRRQVMVVVKFDDGTERTFHQDWVKKNEN